MSVAFPDAVCSRQTNPGARSASALMGSSAATNSAILGSSIGATSRPILICASWYVISNRLLVRVRLEVETVPENHLRNQMVGSASQPDSESEVDLPFGRQVQVNGGEYLVLLVAQRRKPGDRPHGAVILQSATDFLCEIVAELEVRRKHHALVDAFAVKRPVERWIHRKIPSPNLFIHDRANFPSPGIGREFAPLIPDLVRQADSDRPIPFLGNPHARSNVIAHPLHTLSAAFRCEDVKAHLEPVGDAAGDFNGLVLGMIRGQETVLKGF